MMFNLIPPILASHEEPPVAGAVQVLDNCAVLVHALHAGAEVEIELSVGVVW